MAKFLRLGRRGWNGIVMAFIAVVFVYSLLMTWVRMSLQPNADFIMAVSKEDSTNAGLRALLPSSENDPAFTADGMLVDSARKERCAQAVAALADFQRRWLDVSVFEGHRVQSHVLPAVLASNIEALAVRNGCVDSSSLNVLITRIRNIRDNDLRVHGFNDLAAFVPLPIHDGPWPRLYTVHIIEAGQWSRVLDDRQLRLLHCSADMHCDVFKQLAIENTHG
ncbi:MAG: hypothetical protein ACREPQ_00695 [Rhodanobacter sp.]